LHNNLQRQIGVIACLAVHGDYQRSARGNRLLDHAQRRAKQLHLKTLYALSTQTTHWFIERGFQAVDTNQLPEPLKAFYNPERKSKAFYKDIT